MELGGVIAKGALAAGVLPNFSHALTDATPDCMKGIGEHADEECVLGSMLLAVGWMVPEPSNSGLTAE